MARPLSEGLQYFSLDTTLDEKFDLIESKLGIAGFGVAIKLLQKIYREGYFIPWNERELLLFNSKVKVETSLINDVVAEGLKWGLFDQGMFEKHRILTSHGIQLRYITGTQRRTVVNYVKEYLLVSDKEIKYPKGVIVNINSINDNNNIQKEGINSQSKVKESKEKVKKSTATIDTNETIVNNPESQVETAAGEIEIPMAYKPDLGFAKVIQYYSNNVTPFVNDIVSDSIKEFLEKVPPEVYIMAIQEAVKGSPGRPPTINYIEGILRKWVAAGVITAEKVKQHLLDWELQQQTKQGSRASPPDRATLIRRHHQELVEKLGEIDFSRYPGGPGCICGGRGTIQEGKWPDVVIYKCPHLEINEILNKSG